jgi:hypothetical protein
MVKDDQYSVNYIADPAKSGTLFPENGPATFARFTKDIAPSSVSYKFRSGGV